MDKKDSILLMCSYSIKKTDNKSQMSYTVLSISEMIENININEMKEKVRRVKRIIIQGVERAHSKVQS